MRIKVLFVIDSLGCGGAEKSLLSLLSSIDLSLFDVTVMVSAKGGAFECLLPNSVSLLEIPKELKYLNKIYYRLLNKIYPSRHKAELWWEAHNHSYSELKTEFDVAIAYHQGLPTYLVSNKVKAKKKFSWVNVDIKAAGYRESFNRPFYNEYDGIVAVSQDLCDSLSKSNYFDPSKLTTIYDILNVDVIRQMASQNDLSLKSGQLTLTTVGRMVYQKNYPLAVEVARILKENGLGFIWYFVGDGDEHSIVRNKIEEYGLNDNVKLMGFQSNPYPYINACDIYVQTSRFEGFGLTIAEAKILGKPVVSTNFGVVYDQIEDGVNGLIADMSPESVAEKIMMLVDNPDLKAKIEVNVAKYENTTAQTEIAKFYDLIDVNPNSHRIPDLYEDGALNAHTDCE